MAQLPNADQAVVALEKITRYLLDDDHPTGGPKAAFFKSFGFRQDEPEKLVGALLVHALANEATPLPANRHGIRYEVRGTLSAPDGRLPRVKAVWIIRHGEVMPRFVTAFPD